MIVSNLKPEHVCESCNLLLKFCNTLHHKLRHLCIEIEMKMKKIIVVLLLLLTAIVVKAQGKIVVADKSDRTTIHVDDLQDHITAHIHRYFVGFIINEAARVVVKNIVSYEVIITQGTTTDTLVYDQNSNFIRNISQRDTLTTAQKKKK